MKYEQKEDDLDEDDLPTPPNEKDSLMDDLPDHLPEDDDDDLLPTPPEHSFSEGKISVE